MVRDSVFKSPGFYEREIDQSERQAAPLGTPAGVIGTAERGPAFVPVTVGSIPDFNSKFGNFDSTRFGPYAAREFLRHKTALTYLRVLGAGANDTTSNIENTRLTGQVKNSGFVVTGTANADATWGASTVGAVQFIAATHDAVANEAYGFPVFTDSDSISNTSAARLVRGMVMMASGARLLVADGDQALPALFAGGTKDDIATVDASGKFKLVISSTLGSSFGQVDGLPGIKVFTASLDPTNVDYIGKLLNTNPEMFPSEQHLLYGDFAVDAEVSPIATAAGSVSVLSGSAGNSSTSGDSTMSFLNAFGHFNTRYTTPASPYIISQPFGATEYDLFKFESLDDGEYANDKIKISITNVKKSNDPKSEFGTFTVIVRSFDDTDTNQVVLEQFPEVSLDQASARFVGAVIGDKSVRFNFDAESEGERRMIVKGTYPNKSKYVRIVLSSDLTAMNVPAGALPFGFRGYEVLKTSDANNDSGTGNRLWGKGTTNTLVMPPVPMRFKVTRGTSATSAGPEGNPGPSELVYGSLHWGVKFERTTTVLNANADDEQNRLVPAYAKLLGIKKLDVLVTGSGADTLHNNKFSLAKVALTNTVITDITSSAATHMREAAYIRNGVPNTTNYTVTDSNGDVRLTLGSLVALTSSVEFNKFVGFNKFSFFLAGGFDGLNILDRQSKRMSDKAASFDAGGGAESTFTSPGLNSNANGTGKDNNVVKSYMAASRIMTDSVTSGINLLAIPGITEPFVTDDAAQRVKDFGLAMYVMDVQSYDESSNRLYEVSDGRPDVDETADKFDSRGIDNNYAAAYFPDVQIEDTDTNKRVWVPASVPAYAALAFNDKVAYPWFAPAGYNRASLEMVKNSATRLNSGDRDRLNDARINQIAPFPRVGYVIFSQLTLQYAKSALDRVNVRRLLVEVKRAVIDIAMKIAFEQNDFATRQSFVGSAIERLALVQSASGIEKFKVIMDESNNTDDDVDNNRINGKIVIVPTKTAEKLAIDFIITSSGVEFV